MPISLIRFIMILCYVKLSEEGISVHRNTIKVFKGKKTEVCLKCKSRHMKAILDYFGHGIKTTNAEKGYFNAIIEIELSLTFYAWIFQFEGDIIIQSPQKAIDDFIKTAEIIIEVHKRKGTI